MAQSEYSQELQEWVKLKLIALIGVDDFAPLLLSLSDLDLENYCNDLLGQNNSTQAFVNEFIAKRNQDIRDQSQPNNKQKSRRSRNRNKSKNKNDANTMTLDSDPFIVKKQRHNNNKSKPKQSTSTQSSYRQAGAMKINHGPITKKSRSKKHKSMS